MRKFDSFSNTQILVKKAVFTDFTNSTADLLFLPIEKLHFLKKMDTKCWMKSIFRKQYLYTRNVRQLC